MSTIAAIATGQAAGGIGIVRISGENALSVADRIFQTVSGLKLNALKGYRAAFGSVFADGKPIDEAIATVFRAPKSYTGEDVVEISCHGGLYLTRQVLRAALENGAVPAEPGEFTKRAFLNGKLDLAKAEAVMQLICAQGEQASAAALATLEGKLSSEIRSVSQELKALSAALAAWVDYPDEEIEEVSDAQIKSVLQETAQQLSVLLTRFDSGKAILNGVDTVIVGKPNVGKSTLMNCLVGAEKSIVTDIAGTTRDIVEETVTVGNIVLRLSDTAGLRETADAVEQIGVSRAQKKLENAVLILALFDNSVPLTEEDDRLFSLCAGKNAIAVVNKTDLQPAWDANIINNAFKNVVYISAKENTGVIALENAIAEILGTAAFDPSAATLMNERQRSCCATALEELQAADAAFADGITRDAVQVRMDAAIEALDALTGERATESVVNAVFSQFCVGK